MKSIPEVGEYVHIDTFGDYKGVMATVVRANSQFVSTESIHEEFKRVDIPIELVSRLSVPPYSKLCTANVLRHEEVSLPYAAHCLSQAISGTVVHMNPNYAVVSNELGEEWYVWNDIPKFFHNAATC